MITVLPSKSRPQIKMATVTSPKYTFLFILQMIVIGGDMLINSLSLLLSSISATVLLIVFAIQDILICLSIVLTLLSFFNTFAFTSGFVGKLIKKFIWSLSTCGVYLVLSVGYQIWFVQSRWSREWAWSGGLQFVYVVHKLVAIFYYYIYKRSVYRLSDPRLYHINSNCVEPSRSGHSIINRH